MKSFLTQQLPNYRQWDFLLFAVLTLLSVLNGQTTIFYVIYFFWFNELICLIVDRLMHKKNPNAALEKSISSNSVFGAFFQMMVYFVFIVVFFGFLASHENTAIIMANMQVLFLQNWFFNINLLLVLGERIFLHKTKQPLDVRLGMFTPNMIVLHVSIILGAVLMFFVVRNFPTIFTPDNLWGSVLIILPFLLLKMGMQYLTSPSKN